MPFKRRRTFRKKTIDKKQNKRISTLEKAVHPELKQWIQAWTTEFDGTTTIDFSSGVYLGAYTDAGNAVSLPGAETPVVGQFSNNFIETIPMGWGATIPNNVRYLARVINQVPIGATPLTRTGSDIHMMGLQLTWEFQNRSIIPASFDEVVYLRLIVTYDRSQRADLVGNVLSPLTTPHPTSPLDAQVISSRQLAGSKSVKHKRPLTILADTGIIVVGARTADESSLPNVVRRKKRVRLNKDTVFFGPDATNVYQGSVTVHMYLASNAAATPFAFLLTPTIYYIDS